MKKITILLLSTLSLLIAEPSIVKDDIKKILWEDSQHSEDKKLNHAQAINYCQNLVLGEYKNWRLPTLSELLSIVDYTKYKPAILKEFQHVTTDTVYWTKTPYARSSDEVWGVNFKDGATSNASMNYDRYVRCVRNIK